MQPIATAGHPFTCQAAYFAPNGARIVANVETVVVCLQHGCRCVPVCNCLEQFLLDVDVIAALLCTRRQKLAATPYWSVCILNCSSASAALSSSPRCICTSAVRSPAPVQLSYPLIL